MIEWILENDKEITRIDWKMQFKGAPSFSMVLPPSPWYSVLLRGVPQWPVLFSNAPVWSAVVRVWFVAPSVIRSSVSPGLLVSVLLDPEIFHVNLLKTVLLFLTNQAPRFISCGIGCSYFSQIYFYHSFYSMISRFKSNRGEGVYF